MLGSDDLLMPLIRLPPEGYPKCFIGILSLGKGIKERAKRIGSFSPNTPARRGRISPRRETGAINSSGNLGKYSGKGTGKVRSDEFPPST